MMLTDGLKRWATLAAAALLAGAVPTVPAAAADPAAQMFKRLTDPLPRARKVQFCAYVAANGGVLAGEAPDPATRSARATTAARLSARLAPELARANAGFSPENLARIERENREMMGLLSYAPADALGEQLKAGGESVDIIGLFADDVMRRCDALADKLKLPAAPAIAAAEPGFRWFGGTAAETFTGTGLAPFAERLCKGEALAAADFAAAPLAERGTEGTSLLDWAMACGDKAGFAAIVAAGAELDAAGVFSSPPLMQAAGKSDLFWLETLLAAGAKPDALGPEGTALNKAYNTSDPTGGRAWQILRAAGASLNFPSAEQSMWWSFALYADWEQILANWDEFDSDPVALARSISMDLERSGGPRGNAKALEEIKARLIGGHGVCFPVGPTYGAPRDARGYLVQPDCNTARR